MHELRCEGNILHALVEEDPKPVGVVEFRCKSRFCGKETGLVVLHRFDLETGECVTRRYKDPTALAARLQERRVHGTSQPHTPVRLS